MGRHVVLKLPTNTLRNLSDPPYDNDHPLLSLGTSRTSSINFGGWADRASEYYSCEGKGRARLKVDGLYRCEPVKFRIESSLVRDAGIQTVFANVLTGRVLVVFDPSKTVDEIAVLIEGLLAAPAGAEQKTAATIHPLRPLRTVTSANASPVLVQDLTRWHSLHPNAVLSALGTSKDRGLSEASAQLKLRSVGPNSLPESERRSGLSIFLGQFKSLPVVLLGASAVLSAVTGGLADAVVILGVVMINAATGYATEAQAERTINALGHIGQHMRP